MEVNNDEKNTNHNFSVNNSEQNEVGDKLTENNTVMVNK